MTNFYEIFPNLKKVPPAVSLHIASETNNILDVDLQIHCKHCFVVIVDVTERFQRAAVNLDKIRQLMKDTFTSMKLL